MERRSHTGIAWPLRKTLEERNTWLCCFGSVYWILWRCLAAETGKVRPIAYADNQQRRGIFYRCAVRHQPMVNFWSRWLCSCRIADGISNTAMSDLRLLRDYQTWGVKNSCLCQPACWQWFLWSSGLMLPLVGHRGFHEIVWSLSVGCILVWSNINKNSVIFVFRSPKFLQSVCSNWQQMNFGL